MMDKIFEPGHENYSRGDTNSAPLCEDHGEYGIMTRYLLDDTNLETIIIKKLSGFGKSILDINLCKNSDDKDMDIVFNIRVYTQFDYECIFKYSWLKKITNTFPYFNRISCIIPFKKDTEYFIVMDRDIKSTMDSLNGDLGFMGLRIKEVK